MKRLRLLVCGGRNFANRTVLNAVLDSLLATYTIEVLIAGGARGADRLAVAWARSSGIRPEEYPVTPEEWAELGKRAGRLRNTKMLDEGKPNAVIAFPGGPGTANMIQQAESRGIRVWQPLRQTRP